MFQDAETMLVEDLGGLLSTHLTPGDLIKLYLACPALEPDKAGLAGWHWPYFSSFSDLMSGVYVTKDVSSHRTTTPPVAEEVV